MTRAMALVALVAACSVDPEEMYIPIHVAEGVDPEPHIESIEAVWGWEVREEPPSVCTITLHPRGPGLVEECVRDVNLEEYTPLGCRRRVAQIWCSDHPTVCAHELGHEAGLGHFERQGNVMRAEARRDQDRTTWWQDAAVEGMLRAFAHCREIRDR